METGGVWLLVGESFGASLAVAVAAQIDEDPAMMGLVVVNPATSYRRSALATVGPVCGALSGPFLYPLYLVSLVALAALVLTPATQAPAFLALLASLKSPTLLANPYRESYLGRVALSAFLGQRGPGLEIGSLLAINVFAPEDLAFRLSEWLAPAADVANEALPHLVRTTPILAVVGDTDRLYRASTSRRASRRSRRHMRHGEGRSLCPAPATHRPSARVSTCLRRSEGRSQRNWPTTPTATQPQTRRQPDGSRRHHYCRATRARVGRVASWIGRTSLCRQRIIFATREAAICILAGGLVVTRSAEREQCTFRISARAPRKAPSPQIHGVQECCRNGGGLRGAVRVQRRGCQWPPRPEARPAPLPRPSPLPLPLPSPLPLPPPRPLPSPPRPPPYPRPPPPFMAIGSSSGTMPITSSGMRKYLMLFPRMTTSGSRQNDRRRAMCR